MKLLFYTINYDIIVAIKVERCHMKEIISLLSNLENKNKGFGSEIIILIAVIAILAFILAAIIKYNNKTKKKINKYRNSEFFICDEFYNHCPQDLSPALISFIITEGNTSLEMFPLTLFYLAYKGYYKIEEKQVNRGKDLIFIRDIDKNPPDEEHLKFIIEVFKEFEILGAFTLLEVERCLESTESARKFIENINKWEIRVRKDTTNLNMIIDIRNRVILTNYYENERKKWSKYKSYIEEVINTQISKEILEESTLLLIHAKALGIKASKVNKFNDKLIEFNYKNCRNDFQDIVFNNYFMYYYLFEDMYNNIDTTAAYNEYSSGILD